MPVKHKNGFRKSSKKEPAYLTKRIFIKAAREAVQKAAKDTMRIMGYSIIAKNGWIVKLYPDGHIEKISKITKANTKRAIDLD